MNSKRLYSAQCIFLHSDQGHGPKQMYEERIILVRATNADAAIERAEEEAREYTRDLAGCNYVGYINVFEMDDEKLTDGSEIFSSMQASDLRPEEYLRFHYPSIPDDCETLGQVHRWHNLDDKRSACYHCKVIRDGKLWEEKKRLIDLPIDF